jgi:hypothetical protein
VPDSISWEPLPTWDRNTVLGRAVHDKAGSRLGPVADIYVGVRTGAPLWAVLDLGGQTRLIPAATLVLMDDNLAIPFDSVTVTSAPAIGSGAPLSAATERALREHYDRAWVPPGDLLPTGTGTAPARMELVPEGAVSLNALEARQLRAATVRLKRSATHVSGALVAPGQAVDQSQASAKEQAGLPLHGQDEGAGATGNGGEPGQGWRFRRGREPDRAPLRAEVPRRPSGPHLRPRDAVPPPRPGRPGQGGSGPVTALSRDLFNGGPPAPTPTPAPAHSDKPGPRRQGGSDRPRRTRRRDRRLQIGLALVVAVVVALVVGLAISRERRGSNVTTMPDQPATSTPVVSGPATSQKLPGADFEQPGLDGWRTSPDAVTQRVKGGREGLWAASLRRLGEVPSKPPQEEWPAQMTGFATTLPDEAARPGTAVRVLAWVKVTQPRQETRLRLLRRGPVDVLAGSESTVLRASDGWRALVVSAVLPPEAGGTYEVQIGAMNLAPNAAVLVDGVIVETFPSGR